MEAASVDVPSLFFEWQHLKSSLYKQKQRVQEMTWVQVNILLQQKCPNALALVDLILTLPASSAECERGFSRMKATKTDTRNKLKATTMSDLLTIQLSQFDISSFDPTAAIHIWTNHSHRRKPFFKDDPKHGTFSGVAGSYLGLEAEVSASAEQALAAQNSKGPEPTEEEHCGQGGDSDFEFGTDYSEEELEEDIDLDNLVADL